MDVAASFQFLVDALARDWYVIAPDLRGFGRSAWQPQGYWFPDYVADLEALLDALRAGRGGRRSSATASAATSCMHYAGVRPQRVRARGVARRLRHPGRGRGAGARRSSRAGSTRWRSRRSSRPTPSLDAVAERLQKNNPRLPRDQALFLARHWAEALPDGTARLRSDPRHKLPFPTVYRLEEVYAVWRAIAAPVLWVAGAESNIPQWLDGTPRRRRRPTARRRAPAPRAHRRTGGCVTIADAGPHAAPRPARRRGRGDRAVPCRRTAEHPGGARRADDAAASRRGAYVALVALTLIWGANWIVMKLALVQRRSRRLQHPPHVARHRRAVRGAARRGARPLLPESWLAVARHRLLPDDDQLRRDDDGAGRAAAPAARRCWCSRCRSGRCCSRGRCCASACAARSGRDRARVRRARCWSSRRGTGRASSRRSCGRCCRASAGRRGRSRPSTSSATRRFDMLNFIAWQMLFGVHAAHAASPCCAARRRRQWSAVLRCCCSATPASSRSRSRGSCCGSAILRFLPAGTASLNMLAIPVIALAISIVIFGEASPAASGSASRCIGAGLALLGFARPARRAAAVASIDTESPP